MGLLLGLVRLFNVYIRLEEEGRLAAAAAGAAEEAAAASDCAQKKLQRVTPVIVIQPGAEVRRFAHGMTSSADVWMW